MVKWLKRLFHFHEWEIIMQGNIYNRKEQHVGHWFIMQCKVCGKIKEVNLE